jgi:hypothetical protein
MSTYLWLEAQARARIPRDDRGEGVISAAMAVAR